MVNQLVLLHFTDYNGHLLKKSVSTYQGVNTGPKDTDVDFREFYEREKRHLLTENIRIQSRYTVSLRIPDGRKTYILADKSLHDPIFVLIYEVLCDTCVGRL